ncbi:MAG: pyridoxal 5'-phosphate synthase glutaminase subunit PdxT [Sphaerobacteraceae bacterium]|nr:MAG: pyridoxal 5'-phosphate synthase glutaminase subunit PdxT [Sphaerobacteraceae bacterium]
MPKIGVLALQGAFIEHVHRLREIGAEAVEIRLPEDLDGVEALIIPGGESTTIGRLIDWYELREPITEMASDGKPVWGTCAGMILLATDVDQSTRAQHQPLLELMDITVKRNAFGTQLDSFEADLEMPAISGEPMPTVFIRAPIVSRTGPDVEVLGTLSDGKIIAVRQNNLVATAFHPELTGDRRLHSWFVNLVVSSAKEPAPAE